MYKITENDIEDATVMQRFARADYLRARDYLAMGDLKSAAFWQSEMKRNARHARLIMDIERVCE